MALVVKDRVKETSTTAGTGTLTLAGAAAGFQAFSVIGNGNTTYYTIVDPDTGDWEVGIGTYTSSGTTLSRDTILESSTGGTAVSFAANAKDVFVTYPAERAVFSEGSTISGPTINDGYTEEVFAIPSSTTPALSPTNGSIQTWTLTGGSTPTAGTWASGQSMTLMVDDGTANTIDWSSVAVTWKTDSGVAPTLNTSGFTAIALWKVDTVIYGARVGNA
jgi:hypothetical protein